MAKEIVKSLTLTKQKVADLEGEHRITFVASTATEDRDYEHVQIESFRLPLKGGGHIVVRDLPENGADNIDIPLLTDHNMHEVDKTIGSVRKAWWNGTALIFEAGISSRPYAQEMFTLVEEGHLDNAFSIQYRDYEHNFDTNSDYNGEIVEVSLVTRGSNMDAQVLATKSLKGKTVEDEKPTTVEAEAVKVEETTQEEVVETTEPETAPEVEETPAEVAETPAEEEAKEEVEAEEVEAEPEAEEEAEETNINEDKEKSMSHQTEVAKSIVKEATQEKSASADYLKTKSAVADFAKCIAENGNNAMKAWTANLSAKGITGDAILPTEIESIFFKAWQDNPAVLATFGNVRLNTGAVYAFNTSSRALGHKKGEAKADQTLNTIRRDIKAKIIYKKLPIDLQDLIDDQTGELLRFRVQELADRVANEIVVSAILGDGRSESTPDYRTFDGTRGLWSIAGDIAGSTNATANPFSAAVATSLAHSESDTAYDKLIKTINAVEADGRKVVVVAKGYIANILLTKNEQGQYIFTPGTNLEQLLGVRIVELPEMTGAGYDVIAYAEGKYTLFGNQEFVRSRFDDTYNQDVMLVERAVAGSLTGRKVAAGYVAANASA